MIIRAFGDESGTHDQSPVQMLGGYVATLGQWNKFDIGWENAIRRAGLPGYFHATEHWNTEAGAKFAGLQRKLQKKHLLFGYVIELDKDSYQKHYVGGNRPRKPQLDTRYSLCFRYLLALLVTRLPVLLGRQDLMISFVLEEGAAGSADALRVVQLLRKQPETRDFAAMIGDVAFRPKKAYPGLQTSDGLAFGALKLRPTAPPMIDLPENVTLQTIRKTVEWKPPVYHCRLDRSHLAPLKSDILSLVEIRRRIADDHKKR